jgi:hypothetical protein
VLVDVTAFVAVADVCVAADGLSAPVTGASAPVVVPAREAGASATVAIGALPEVAVEGAVVAELTAVVTGEVAEETGDVAELTAVVTGDVAELTAVVTGDVAELVVAELTAEVTGDVTELTGEVTAERGDPGSGVSEVAACACRENTSMMTNIPAATIASCTARRAMRRKIGCGMSSSHWPETGRGTRAHYQGLQSRVPRPS